MSKHFYCNPYLKTILFLSFLFGWFTSYGQQFSCDSRTDFFTVNKTGEIQQWRLVNNTVSGGSVILTGANKRGLSFCGADLNSRTFYTSISGTGVLYFDTLAKAWVRSGIPHSRPVNNGCFLEDQYYMEGLDSLYYYNGIDHFKVPEVPTMTVADIAVDTLGRAWVFTGSEPGQTTHLRIYEPTGQVASYNFNFKTSGAYGAFFLNGQLYIAKSRPGEIFPISIVGNTVTAGAPISFPSVSNYVDIADCQCSYNPEPPVCNDLTPAISLFMGNVAGRTVVETAVELTEVNGEDTDGTAIKVRIPVDPRLSFVWNSGLTMVAFTPVQNSDWNYLGDNGLFHVWMYNGLNSVISGGATSAFGFQAFYDHQSTDGQTTITASVVLFSGGDCNMTNNSDSEQLIYFQ